MVVKSAFLNQELKEEFYPKQPLGFGMTGEEKVLRLRKAYGLRQAPRAWNAKLDYTLKESILNGDMAIQLILSDKITSTFRMPCKFIMIGSIKVSIGLKHS
jgi:hypothetical protein